MRGGAVVLALGMLGWVACSDGGSSVLDDVVITSTGASAVFGGCGDAAPWPEPDGGYVPCGAPRDFSVELTVENKGSVPKTLGVAATIIVLDESGQEIATTSPGTITVGGAPFDGQLPPGTTVLKVELDSFYASFSGYSDTIHYRVTLAIDGKQTSVDSPTTTYSGPPA